jgi:hypothetical protein
MAEYDNNQSLWKWEYIPWNNKVPIKVSGKTRKQLDDLLSKEN